MTLRTVRTPISLLRGITRYGYVPFMLIGLNGLALYLAGRGVPPWMIGTLSLVALASAFVAERILPYDQTWNESHGDVAKDTAHGIVYELDTMAGVLLVPLVASAIPWQGIWPLHWPLWSQVLVAILFADVAMTLIHYVSHRVSWLWRFHSVHHGVTRLYGFNGLVGHPLHLQFDLIFGSLPLVLAGMPVQVAVLLGTAIAIQLIVQHSNVDFRLGPFGKVLAIGACHRLHHVNWPGEGDVNFGLFFTIWDRALGTLRLTAESIPATGDIGVQDEPNYPQRYLTQLALPFVRTGVAN